MLTEYHNFQEDINDSISKNSMIKNKTELFLTILLKTTIFITIKGIKNSPIFFNIKNQSVKKNNTQKFTTTRLLKYLAYLQQYLEKIAFYLLFSTLLISIKHHTMRKPSFYLITVLFLIATNAFAQKRNQRENLDKKVAFIIVDGIAEDMLDSVETPNLDRIKKDGLKLDAHVGGDKGSYNETPTISAVGYNSLLTGTWYNKHNVGGNYNQDPNYNYPTIFKLFSDRYPNKRTAIFSTWEDNRTVLIGSGLEETGNLQLDYAYDGLERDSLRFPTDNEGNNFKMIDYLVAEKAAEHFKNKAPDLSWVYLQHSDDVAHQYGDSPILYTNIKYEDQLIGKVYDAVKKRASTHNEDWLFIVTTDHGRNASGYGHGGQSERERNTWIYLNKSQVNSYAKNNRVGIVDLAPTILNFLKVDLPATVQKEMDGIDLLSPVFAYDLKASFSEDNKLRVKWKTTPTAKGKAEVFITNTNNFKTGGKDTYHKVGKTRLKSGELTEKLNLSPSSIYKVVLETPNGSLNTWIKK